MMPEDSRAVHGPDGSGCRFFPGLTLGMQVCQVCIHLEVASRLLNRRRTRMSKVGWPTWHAWQESRGLYRRRTLNSKA